MSRKDPIRAIGYVRVSTEEQATSGLSLAHQKIRIVAFARASDFNLVEVIEEPGKSGKNLKRHDRALENSGWEARALVIPVSTVTRSVRISATWSVPNARNRPRLGSGLHQHPHRRQPPGLNVLSSIAQWNAKLSPTHRRRRSRKTPSQEKTGGTVPYGYDLMTPEGSRRTRTTGRDRL